MFNKHQNINYLVFTMILTLNKLFIYRQTLNNRVFNVCIRFGLLIYTT